MFHPFFYDQRRLGSLAVPVLVGLHRPPPPPHITLLVRAVMAELYYLLKSFYRPLNSQM